MAKERQVIEVPEFLTVRELADLISASPIEVMKQLINNGIMATINQFRAAIRGVQCGVQ